MVDFPEVVLKQIFDFLGIRERLRVRSTCKKWRFVADTLSHQPSVCIYSVSYPYNERWCFSDQRVTEEEMVYLKFDREASRPFDLRMEFFRNLQKVCLYYIMEKVELFLEEANQLKKLKVLMIEESRIDFRTLNSSSLEKLSLKCFHFGHIQLNTPNLSSLILWDRFPNSNPPILEFGFPLKVKHLECIEFSSNLGQLKNLEKLVCSEITFEFKLNEFKSLARMEIWSSVAFRKVQNERRRLNRTNLQILASCFEETVGDEPHKFLQNYFCYLTARKEKFQLNRWFLEIAESNQWNLAAGSILWKFSLDPETFVSFASRIPQVFFDKLRIDEIFYFKPNETGIDQSTVVELMERSSPSSFNTSSYSLSRDNFERLSRIQSIRNFRGVCDIESADFLLNLKNLECVEISSSTISIDFICRLFKELKFFCSLYFHTSDSTNMYLYIRFYNCRPEDLEADGAQVDTLYGLFYCCQPARVSRDLIFKNLDELIEEVKRMREKETIQSFFV